MLQGALLGGEAVAERLELVVVGGGGQLGLDARLEAGLGLGHELGAHVVPRAKVGGGNRHGQIREVADLNLRLDLRLDLLRKREQPSALKKSCGAWLEQQHTMGRIVSLRTQSRHTRQCRLWYLAATLLIRSRRGTH